VLHGAGLPLAAAGPELAAGRAKAGGTGDVSWGYTEGDGPRFNAMIGHSAERGSKPWTPDGELRLAREVGGHSAVIWAKGLDHRQFEALVEAMKPALDQCLKLAARLEPR
jgi:hypothetical protein